MGHGGTTSKNVSAVPPSPVYTARVMSSLAHPMLKAMSYSFARVSFDIDMHKEALHGVAYASQRQKEGSK